MKKQRKERKHENLRNEIVREKRVGGDFSYRLYETKKMGLQKCARGLLSGRIFLDRLYETKKLPPKKCTGKIGGSLFVYKIDNIHAKAQL